MTEAQQMQCDRLIAAGYDPGLAAQLIQHGAWLEACEEMDEETVANVRRYRAERDAAARGETEPK